MLPQRNKEGVLFGIEHILKINMPQRKKTVQILVLLDLLKSGMYCQFWINSCACVCVCVRACLRASVCVWVCVCLV